MPKSRALKDDLMGSMMNEAHETIKSASDSMMRGKVMMMGAKAMQGVMKKKKMDMSKYDDLGGMNFDPKKMKKR